MVILTEAREQVDSNGSHRTSIRVASNRQLAGLFLLSVRAYSNERGQTVPDARLHPSFGRPLRAAPLGRLLGITPGHTPRNSQEPLLSARNSTDAAIPRRLAIAAHSHHWQYPSKRMQLDRDLCLLRANQASSLEDFHSLKDCISVRCFQAQDDWVAAANWFAPTNLATLSTN
jgi:hypothetical protein